MKLQLLLKPEQENTSLRFRGDFCLLQSQLNFLNETDHLLLLLENNILIPHWDSNPGFQSKV